MDRFGLDIKYLDFHMINRRQFVKRAAICYGSLLLLPGCVRRVEKEFYRVFSREEAECLGVSVSNLFLPMSLPEHVMRELSTLSINYFTNVSLS